MLKKVLLTGAWMLPFYLFAQTTMIVNGSRMGEKMKLKDPEIAIGEVVYDFTYVSDTTHPENPQKETMVLDFSSNYSKFYSQTYKISDSLRSADMTKQLKDQEGQANLTFSAKAVEGNADIFLSDKKTAAVSELKNFVRKPYLITDGKSAIDWDIQDSTKSIGAYTCQKAVGASHGRQYIVWFTTDLPYSFGPRRLGGLPGLILEAYDVSNRIVYTFKQYNTISGIELGIPENAIASTEKEFADMQAAFRANPSAFLNGSINSSSAPSGAGVPNISKIKSISINSSPSSGNATKKKVINFPIDLPSK